MDIVIYHDEINDMLTEFNRCELYEYQGSRRGFCGQINISTFFKKLIRNIVF